MLNLTQHYSPRELFGLVFLTYINGRIVGNLFLGKDSLAASIVDHTSMYTCVDTVWLYFDTRSAIRVPKWELYTHHAMVMMLIYSNTPVDQQVSTLVVESTTLLLMIMRLPLPAKLRKALKSLLGILWISLRIVWNPIQLYYIKQRDYYGSRVITLAAYVCFNIVYLLNIKWTGAWLKALKKPDHCSSIALSLPLLVTRNIPVEPAAACCLLTYISYVNHTMNSKLTISLDHSIIVYTCAVYMDMGVTTSAALAVAAGWRKHWHNESSWTNIIYMSSVGYFCCLVTYGMVVIPLLVCGYTLLRTENKKELWHVGNGVWISLVTAHKYGWDWQNSSSRLAGIS